MNTIEECFKVSNADKNSLYNDSFVIHLKNIIQENVKQCINDKLNIYYGPFTTLVQSSGTGKSRACCELANEMFVLYICLRPNNSTGYPPRSHLSNDIMKHDEFSIF